MRKKEKAALVHRMLEEFYPNPPKGFLEHKDHFTLLISVLLSAQCTDARVNLTTPKLFALADTPEKMAQLSVAEVTEIVRPCGLVNRKAPAIVELSRILTERYGGKVPQTFEELEALPGVGHKTASVMMVQAFEHPAFPVDTHIYRLARRWGLSKGKSPGTVEKDLKKSFPEEVWGKLHLQMILYGREYCTARGCDGKSCPICSHLNQ